MAVIIDGKQMALEQKREIVKAVNELKSKNVFPCLAVVMVGEDEASKVYVRNRKKDCDEMGFLSKDYIMSENTSEQELLKVINELNDNNEVHAILIQLPLPDHIDTDIILNSVNPLKDVDVFHPDNLGKIMLGNYRYLPCTPAAVMQIIENENIETEGKKCVVVGRSNIVGKPVSMLMLNANATVTICHSKTKNLKEICKNADILIAAVGKAKFVTADMVKDGAVVIDVGINRDENNKLCGDVDFENIKDNVSFITPVPGGVGPMTRHILLQNTLKAAKILSKCD